MPDLNEIRLNGTSYNLSGSGSGLTEDVKTALLQLVSKVAYIDENGQDYYDALESALYPPANLSYIRVVYTQSGVVYDTTPLDSLKSDLVVTAYFDNGTSRVVTSYTLSGTLTEGTSTITVSYGGKTTTFNVTVTVIGPLEVLGGKGSGWPSVSETEPYALSITPSSSSISMNDNYWTIMKVSDIKGGTVHIKFNGTIASGNIQIMMYASRNQGMTDIVATLNNASWDEEYSFTQNTRAVNTDVDIPLIDNAYTWIWVRNGGIIMDDDTVSGGDVKQRYILDGKITFTID